MKRRLSSACVLSCLLAFSACGGGEGGGGEQAAPGAAEPPASPSPTPTVRGSDGPDTLEASSHPAVMVGGTPMS